jgi:serine/threonine-protein kinase
MPVLIDFGAVKATMSTTLATGGNSTQSIVIGTPGFMPAEQSVGRPVYASDLYALGLTAIYLLTGKIPEQLESDPLTGEFIWQQFAPNLNPKFSQIVAQCIKSHSRERFLTAIQMKEALQQVKFSPRNIVTLGYIPPHEQEFFPTPPTEISASPTQIMSPVSSSPSISNSMPPVVQQKGLSIGQVITLFVAILGVIAAGGLGYFLYQQQQEFQSKIAELEATQQEKEDAEKEAEAKQQEEEKAQLQAEKERLQQEKQELQTKLTQQQQSSGSSLSTNNNISAALPRLASCGSPAGSGTVWYPVLGNAKALHLVKNNYCADAFITKNGNLQVASFTSTDEAEQFARLLSNATGYNFWVKY